MKKTPKKLFSFKDDLNFETLSQLLNDVGILTHLLTNEQKVCIEYPNISSESKDMNILSGGNENPEAENIKENKQQNEFTLNLSKTKNFTIDINKLYKKYDKNFIYSEEVFKNSIKIFVSIFNNFNEDIFKYNLEDPNLFNASNKIQFFLIKDIMNTNIKVSNELNKLYKEHLNTEIKLEEKNSGVKEKISDDFDDFEDGNKNIENTDNKINEANEDDFEENIEIIGGKKNDEEEIIYRNIYFLMNIMNLLNYFSIKEFTINNLMRNISLLNSYIINDIKILLLIYFNLCIQINLTLSKQTIDNFLGISSPDNKIISNAISSVSSAINSISKSMNLNFFGENDKLNKNNKSGINTYIPSLYFIDLLLFKENENDLDKDNIILFNFIIKTFIWNYFIRNKIVLKIFIKIFNLEKFHEMKKEILVLQKLEKKDKIYELIKTTNYVNILNDNLSKDYLILMNADFSLIYNLNLAIIDNFFNVYFPIFINCTMISFEINNQREFCSLIDYIEELNIIIWLFKFYLKIRRYKFKKHTFTFLSNSFSLAFKKNKEEIMEESYTKEITLFMGINNYKAEELIKYLSDINNFNGVYKLYKLIIKSCNEYQTYDIGIRLFKEDIINKELNYYICILVLKLQNYISSHVDIYKKLVLYENKIINPLDCVYLNIKKKLLTMKNKQNSIQLKEKGENKVLNKISKIDFIGILKKNGNDSNAEKNSDNLNDFYKKLGVIGLKHEEKTAIYRFINENKFYFNEFIVYFSSSIISTKNKQKNMFDPLNILNHFANNKCFLIIIDNSILDVYLYLTDSFEMNIIQYKDTKDDNNKIKNKHIFFNSIMANLKLLKFLCKENFENKKGHLLFRNVNIIINKSTLLQQDLFYDYKSLFAEDNIIFVLDEYTKTNCVFGKKSISLLSNFEKDENQKNNNEKNYQNFFNSFYTMFLNSYGIIKFINDKKVRKFNKISIIYNDEIMQIKEGNIQIKKIYNQNENDNDEEIGKNNVVNNIEVKHNVIEKKKTDEIIVEQKEENEEEKKEEIEIKDENNNIDNDKKQEEEKLNENNEIKINEIKEAKEIKDNKEEDNPITKYIEYNLLKINELFYYQNSYPLMSIILPKESEISNFSFLFYAFEEIFLSKKEQEIQITKQIITKKIYKFFSKFKSSDFTPIIYDQKYFFNFLDFFERIINKKENSAQHFFQNLILFFFNEENDIHEIIKNIIKEKGILNNFVKKIHVIKINSENNYNKNIFGRMVKFNRIKNTLKEIYQNSEKNEENEGNIVIYNVNEKILNDLVKKNNKNNLGSKSEPSKEIINAKGNEECLIF